MLSYIKKGGLGRFAVVWVVCGGLRYFDGAKKTRVPSDWANSLPTSDPNQDGPGIKGLI